MVKRTYFAKRTTIFEHLYDLYAFSSTALEYIGCLAGMTHKLGNSNQRSDEINSAEKKWSKKLQPHVVNRSFLCCNTISP